MKEQLTIISDDLNQGIITEKEARTKLLILFGVSVSLPTTEDSGVLGCKIANKHEPKLTEEQKPFYIKGFMDAIIYVKTNER